jgi:hypothetical protein
VAITSRRTPQPKWPGTFGSNSVPLEHRKVRRRCAAVQEIAEWLDKLGMSEYRSALLKTESVSLRFAI